MNNKNSWVKQKLCINISNFSYAHVTFNIKQEIKLSSKVKMHIRDFNMSDSPAFKD